MRPYLKVELKGEDYPLLIKLKGNDTSCLSAFLTKMSIKDTQMVVEFYTGYIDPVDTIDGVTAEIISYFSGFGSYRAQITLDMERVELCTVCYLPEGCDFIAVSRGYYERKYGVKYAR